MTTPGNDKLENKMRNLYGQEHLVSDQTKFTDLTITAQLKDNYLGDTNGEILILCGLSNGQILLLPISRGNTYRHTLDQKGPNIYSGGKAFSVSFHPHKRNIFAALIDDPSNNPPGIALVVASYDRSQIHDVTSLNKSVKLLAKTKPVHFKRGLDLFWNPIVQDLLYTFGNDEINLFALSPNPSANQMTDECELQLQKISMYVCNDFANFVTDACISHDGRFIGACFMSRSSEHRGTFLKIFRADFEASQAKKVSPIASMLISKGQVVKLCFVPSGKIIASRFKMGSREVSLLQFNENTNELTEIHCIDIEGSTPLRLRSSNAFDVFYAFGRGDTSVKALCVTSDNNLILLGAISLRTSLAGVVFFPEYQRNIMKFEIQRLFIFVTSQNSSNVSGQVYCFTLPRRGDPEEVGCYSPLPYFEASADITTWISSGSRPIPIKYIDPVINDDCLQELNILDQNIHSGDQSNKSGTLPATVNDEFADLSQFMGNKSVVQSQIKTNKSPSTFLEKPQPANVQNTQNKQEEEKALQAKSMLKPISSSFSTKQETMNDRQNLEKEQKVESKEEIISTNVPVRANYALTKRIDVLESNINKMMQRIEILEKKNDAKEEFLRDLDL